jgi:hypothetical protein
MPIRYKLTDRGCWTYGGFLWPEPNEEKPGKWVKVSGVGGLCGPGWFHFYDNPLLAVLHNLVHASIVNPRLWKAEVAGRELRDGQLKCGWTRARLVQELPLPEITTTQRVAYGILCAREVVTNPTWIAWADAWLSGADRTREAATRVLWVSERVAAGYAAEAAIGLATDAGVLVYVAVAQAAQAAQGAAMNRGDNLNLLVLAKKALKY